MLGLLSVFVPTKLAPSSQSDNASSRKNNDFGTFRDKTVTKWLKLLDAQKILTLHEDDEVEPALKS